VVHVGRRAPRIPAYFGPQLAELEPFDLSAFLGPKDARPPRANFHRIWTKARAKVGVPDLHLHARDHRDREIAVGLDRIVAEARNQVEGHAGGTNGDSGRSHDRK
jgi:hypothetical protein